MLNQQYQEPWLAIVIDPTRTASTGKVEIGAFRTYPQGYKPPDEGPSEFESVPLGKIEDFGAHQNQYYQLDMSYFKSSSDTALLNTLWNKRALPSSSSLCTRARPPPARAPSLSHTRAAAAAEPSGACAGRRTRHLPTRSCWLGGATAHALCTRRTGTGSPRCPRRPCSQTTPTWPTRCPCPRARPCRRAETRQHLTGAAPWQIKDLADKIEQAEGQLAHFGRGGGSSYVGARPPAASHASPRCGRVRSCAMLGR